MEPILHGPGSRLVFVRGVEAEMHQPRPADRGAFMAYLKLALIPVAAVLWLVGLADQLPDLVQTAKYVGISLLMVAVAVI